MRQRSHWDVFGVFVQQPGVCLDQKLLCTLLLVSSSVRKLIVDSCKGRAHLSLKSADIKHVRRFCLWLQSHAQLINTLDWEWGNGEKISAEDLQTAEATIAAALQAAASKQQLHVQSYTCQAGTGTLQLAILKQLPPSTLCKVRITSPTWHFDHKYSRRFRCTWQKVLAGTDTALAGLSQLQSLHLDARSIISNHNYVKQLSPLTALTALHISGFNGVRAQVLTHLPANLKVLDTRMSASASGGSPSSTTITPKLDIGHLTALTKLLLRDDYAIGQRDTLPPKVVDLQLMCGGAAVQPLLRLRKLESLELSASCLLLSKQLMQVAGTATGLSRLCLTYNAYNRQTPNTYDLQRESRCWPCLPIKQLRLVGHYTISSQIGQRLAAIGRQGLTSLELDLCRFKEAPRMVAKHLEGMKHLQQLELRSILKAPGALHACLAGTRAVLQAIAGLSQLRSLEIDRMGLQGLAKELACMKHGLQRLVLNSCELTDSVVAEIMHGCLQLRELSVGWNSQLTNEAFAAKRDYNYTYYIYQEKPCPLVHLTSLNIMGTRVHPQCDELQRLTTLKQLLHY